MYHLINYSNSMALCSHHFEAVQADVENYGKLLQKQKVAGM